MEQWIPVLFSGLHVTLVIMSILAICGLVDWTK